MVSKALFSKATDHWATPPDLYEKLNEEFEFDFDPCPLNAKHDSLAENYFWYGNCFINPPYSQIRAFLEKGMKEIFECRVKTLVYLLPARTAQQQFNRSAEWKTTLNIKNTKKSGTFGNFLPGLGKIVSIY